MRGQDTFMLICQKGFDRIKERKWRWKLKISMGKDIYKEEVCV
jgi:hypothetical protein